MKGHKQEKMLRRHSHYNPGLQDPNYKHAKHINSSYMGCNNEKSFWDDDTASAGTSARLRMALRTNKI